MNERLKSFGAVLLGVILFVAIFAVVGAVIFGVGWLSSKVLPVLNVVSFFLVPLALFIFVPLGFVRATRTFAGNSLYVSSYVFGLTLWMTALVTTLQLWGLVAAVIGLCFAGVGVVPVAFLATLFKGEWLALGGLFFLTALTFGSRALGLQRLVKAHEERHDRAAMLEQTQSGIRRLTSR